MESDDSNGGSSSPSNSTSNSSSNSRASTPGIQNEPDEGLKSPPASPVDNLEQLTELSQSSVGKNSIVSDSSSSSSSSDGEIEEENDNEHAKSVGSEYNEAVQNKSKEHSRSSSFAGSPAKPQSPASAAPQSPQSPASRTSRTSSRNQSPISAERSRNQSPISPERTRVLSRNNSISHEDLSDVSDMDIDRTLPNSPNCEILTNSRVSPKNAQGADDEKQTDDLSSFNMEENNVITDLRQRLDQKKNQTKVLESNGLNNSGEHVNKNGNNSGSFESLVKTHDDEDALDFEAEEGECPELNKDDENVKDKDKADNDKQKNENKLNDDLEEGEELEEGEVSDEDEKRPEESEPKPVCRFYTRGQCTWGMSCRFLHPGVTDKGNYTMFDMMPPVAVPPGGAARRDPYGMHAGPDYRDYRTERPAMHHRTMLPHSAVLPPAAPYSPLPVEARALISETPVVVESAWERGLRTAKEMLCKAKKRKEQDMDFEDKKMNLTLSPDELEKDPYYLKDRSPIDERVNAPPYGRHPPNIYPEGPERGIYSPPERYSRAPPIPSYDDVDPYSRSARYRELPPHRMPHYEDERRVRPTREVIVQRVDPPLARGDEWNDPWMRSKSPLARAGSRERTDKRRRDRRSYSSQSSYSSSSSSQSDSSSGSSRSPSPAPHRRRYNSGSHKSPPPPHSRGKNIVRGARSPSPPPVRRPRRSPIAIKKEDRKNEAWEAKHFQKTGAPLLPKRRGHMSPSPQLDIRRGPMSPVQKRKKNSPGKKLSTGNAKIKGKRHRPSSSSPSGSSDSSASDSDSSSSSSTASSSRSRDRSVPKRGMRFAEKTSRLDKHHPPIKKTEGTKKRSPISIELKRPNTVGTSALMSPPSSSHGSASHENDQKKTRREELLKQLRAVEDAIAKKRSKLS